MYSYLKNRKQRTKINSAYSLWEEILFGDLFYMMSDTDFASYADDNTPYVSADTVGEVLNRPEIASVKLFK